MSPPAGNDQTPTAATRKAAVAAAPLLPCPRCNSLNTKFCYYNNYSLTQPRHFCKTCRRYWTKGGALRNVPIGGGCRKTKKIRISPPLSADISGLRFFHGVAPAMDFQLNFHSSPPSTVLLNHFSSGFGDSSNTSAAIPNLDLSAPHDNSPLLGFNLPANREMGFRSILASSMESLSSINQDLHWKLQKQRLASIPPTDNLLKNCNSLKPQPILFQDLEIPSKQESFEIKTTQRKEDDEGTATGNHSTEWFFDNTGNYATAATTTSNGINNVDNGSGWSSGIQPWSDLSQYSSIP